MTGLYFLAGFVASFLAGRWFLIRLLSEAEAERTAVTDSHAEIVR